MGLDGLRAVSFLAVLFYHANFPWARGGYLGVEVFFVISGFLITGLMLKEYAKTGSIDLLRFWKRRARRLLPALMAFIAVIATVGVFLLGSRASQFRQDLLASLAYVENWEQIRSGKSYFADQGLPLLRHLWSLAVEGQFYLLWPFLVAGAARFLKGRIWPLAVFTTVLAVASFALMLRLADPFNVSSLKAAESLNRVYLGTDTRAFGLLAGALLAMGLRPGQGRRWLDHVVNFGSLAAFGGLCVLMGRVDAQTPFLYRGGFVLVDVLTLAVIVSLVRPGTSWMRSALAWKPLEFIGLRSYGLYLWHWPAFKLVAPGAEGLLWLALRVAVTFAVTEVSYRYLEVPIRQGALKRWFRSSEGGPSPRRLRLRYAAVTILGIFFFSEARMLARMPEYVDPVEQSIRAGAAALDNLKMATPPAPALETPGKAAPAKSAEFHTSSSGGGKALPLEVQEVLKGIHVTAIGDSVMKGAALNLKKMGDANLGDGNILINAEECRSFSPALQICREYRKEDRLGEVVVIHLGTNNSSLSSDQFHKLMEQLSDRKLVIFLTVQSDKASSCEVVNRTLASLMASAPNARLFDWKTASLAHPEFFYSDQTHLRPEGAQYYAELILKEIARYTKEDAAHPSEPSRTE